MNYLFEANHLCKSYGKRKVVDSFSFHINPGEIVGFLGPNGAGKTTAFYMAIGLISVDKGTIFFKEKEITKLPVHKRAKLGIGYLAQEPSVFRSLSVEENLLCILQTLPISKKERLEQVESAIEDLQLQSIRKSKAFVLSGGERRRVEISRALLTKPSLLLLDEPFANIDPISVQELKKLILLLKGKGISILITDHNAREFIDFVDRTYLLHEGKKILSGSMKELINDPIAKKYYFGESFSI